jgi:hypothetical protein
LIVFRWSDRVDQALQDSSGTGSADARLASPFASIEPNSSNHQAILLGTPICVFGNAFPETLATDSPELKELLARTVPGLDSELAGNCDTVMTLLHGEALSGKRYLQLFEKSQIPVRILICLFALLLVSSAVLLQLQSNPNIRRYYNYIVSISYPSTSASELEFWNAVRAAMRCLQDDPSQLSGIATPEEASLLQYSSLAAARKDVRYMIPFHG